MSSQIPVIDLFAGPGGLGEGFSALDRGRTFKIKLSIEMDKYAHQTLLLRAFFRQFPDGKAPKEYYDYLRSASKGRHREADRLKLFRNPKFGDKGDNAECEAQQITLGEGDPEVVRGKIRTALGKARDGDWVLVGGPPCQAYSVVGRSRMLSKRGEVERDGRSFDSDHRHLLYVEYLRVIAEHAPPVFVMENVRGLLSATHNGQNMFDQILKDLELPADSGSKHDFEVDRKRFPKRGDLKYRVVPAYVDDGAGDVSLKKMIRDSRDYLVKSERYGVPQARHRLILIGIRQDRISGATFTGLDPSEPPDVKEVLNDLPKLRSRCSSRGNHDFKSWRDYAAAPGEWIRTTPDVGALDDDLKVKIYELAEKLKRRSPIGTGSEFKKKTKLKSIPLGEWYHDARLGGVCNHTSRSHREDDLGRYFYVAAFAKVMGRSPTLRDFPDDLMPDHASARGRTAFSDRFRVQVANRPSTTVTSHIAKDGHAFIHYDPIQARGLTVREAARLQTFPDNYFFEGPRTSQYAQVGNAVPPYLAYQVADVVKGLLGG